MEPLVTVIIPVYDSQDWLKECIDSVLKQTMQDFEIICVDDGSTDNSGSILCQYAKEDERITVLSQSNKGPGAARNTALDIARGKYIYFLDSDDYIKPDSLEIACREMDSKALDILLFDTYTFGEGNITQNDVDRKNRYYDRNSEYSDVCNGEDLFCRLVDNGDYSCSVWKQLIRNDFLQKNRLRFREGVIHEDELYSLQALMLAGRVLFLPQVLPTRRLRDNSIMTRPTDFQSVYGTFVFIKDAYLFLISRRFSEEKLTSLFSYLRSKVFLARKRYLSLSMDERLKFETLPAGEKFLFQLYIYDYYDVKRQYNKSLKKVKTSWSYTIGRIITYLPRKIKKLLKE